MYHHLLIVGRLGRDPEMRYTPDGTAVTNMSVATTRKTKGPDGDWVDQTIWVRVSVWGKQAEACNQFLKKGRMVLVRGELTSDPETGGPRLWKNKEGAQQASFEMRADVVRFLSGKTDDESEASPKTKPATESSYVEDDNGIPF